MLGSSWLIFGLGAIGFVLRETLWESQIQEGFFLIGIIGVILGLGQSIIFTLDLLVYQEMLDAVYIEKRALESANSWLPQTANNTRILLKGKGKKLISGYYYFSIGLSFWFGGAGLVIEWMTSPENTSREIVYYTSLLILIIISLILIYIFLNHRLKSTQELERDSGLFESRKNHYINFSSDNIEE